MFRFTIRDLLWLTVVVALAVGWRIDHRALTDRIDDLEYNIRLILRADEPTIDLASP